MFRLDYPDVESPADSTAIPQNALPSQYHTSLLAALSDSAVLGVRLMAKRVGCSIAGRALMTSRVFIRDISRSSIWAKKAQSPLSFQTLPITRKATATSISSSKMPGLVHSPESPKQRHPDSQQHGRFRMPAESALHSHTLMAFPSVRSAESQEHLEALQSEVTSIANTISRFEPVHLYASEELISQAKSMVGSNVFVKPATVNELWIRDSGPVYVQDLSTGKSTAVSFNFNYWGGKLPAIGDQDIAAQIATHANEPSVTSKLSMEGGGIEHDGEGTFLGTESCILNNNRNPGFSKEKVEAELRDKLGVTHFIWVPGIKDYDITDYHIDALARFVSPGVVLLSKPSPKADSIAVDAYKSARSVLASAKDAKGRTLTVYDCEEPETALLGPPDQFNEVVASYANYLLVNGAVIMPKFGQAKQDTAAFELFQKLFPDREVVQVLLNILPRTGGGIHCATQQVPQV